MEAARGVFAGAAPFDPRETDRELSIASTDFAALALLPPLLRRLEREAPRAAVSTAGLAATWPELLEAGTLDLAIGFAGQTGPGLRWQALFEDRFVCVARKGHSAFGRGLTLARYLALDHLSVTAAPTKRDAIDAALARQRRRRTVRVRTTHFLVAPALLRAGELVLTTGARVGEALCRMAPLELTACPVELAPLRLGQYWHERSDRDRAHMWFRALVKDTAAASSS